MSQYTKATKVNRATLRIAKDVHQSHHWPKSSQSCSVIVLVQFWIW